MQQVMEEGAKGSVDVRLLPAFVAELAFQLGSAVEALALMRVSVGTACARLYRATNQRSGRNIPNGFDIRHATTPAPDIMRCRGRVLAVSA